MLNGIPRILIVRLSAIGDVVRVLPALHCLREVYPDAQIDWVVERRSADIVTDHPALDRVLVFDRTDDWRASAKAFWRLCREIRRDRYDIVLDFHGLFKSGCITAFSGAAERYGFARPRSRELSYLATNRKVAVGGEITNRMHENLALCNQFRPGYKSLDVTMYIPEDAEEFAESFFEAQFDGAKKVVAMHAPVEPGRPEKQWPLRHYAELCDMLLSDGRFEVMLTWGPGQYEVAEEVAARAKRNPVVAPETETLKDYMALVRCADLYVGGDTGPMHIASALDVPVVSIFGGTDPKQHATLRRPCEVLAPAKGETIDGIAAETVYDACVKIIL